MEAYYQGQKVQIVGGLLNWNPLKNTGYAQIKLPNKQIKTATYQELEIVSECLKPVCSVPTPPLVPVSVSTFVVDETESQPLLEYDEQKQEDNPAILSDKIGSDLIEQEQSKIICHINKITRSDIGFWAEELNGIGQVSLSKMLDNRPDSGYSDINQFFALNDNVRLSKEAKESIREFFSFD